MLGIYCEAPLVNFVLSGRQSIWRILFAPISDPNLMAMFNLLMDLDLKLKLEVLNGRKIGWVWFANMREKLMKFREKF